MSATVPVGMAYHHEMRIRYGEIDMQGVVFNAHYLAFVDDAMTAWMRSVGFTYPNPDLGFDFMVRHADLDFTGGATFDELLEIDAGVERWGTSSFTVLFSLHVAGRPVAEVRIVYVAVMLGTTDPITVPAGFRERLDA